MSEEEAIEWAKALLQDKEKYAKYHSWVGTNTFVSIQTLLNLIEKQQRIMKSQEKIIMEQEKEITLIKELNLQDNRTLKMQGEVLEMYKNNFIRKDKLREKIKKAKCYAWHNRDDEYWANVIIESFEELLDE